MSTFPCGINLDHCTITTDTGPNGFSHHLAGRIAGVVLYQTGGPQPAWNDAFLDLDEGGGLNGNIGFLRLATTDGRTLETINYTLPIDVWGYDYHHANLVRVGSILDIRIHDTVDCGHIRATGMLWDDITVMPGRTFAQWGTV